MLIRAVVEKGFSMINNYLIKSQGLQVLDLQNGETVNQWIKVALYVPLLKNGTPFTYLLKYTASLF